MPLRKRRVEGFASLRDKFDPPRLDLAEGSEDQEALELAMSDVRPLKPGPRRVKHCQPRPQRSSALLDPAAPLHQFMDQPEIDWPLTPDYIEGGRDRSQLRKLRRGDYSVQGELDLHGLTREQAFLRLERFIQDCRQRGWTCVRVIHGVGQHSPDCVPVLKRSLQNWLSKRRLGRHVIAYATARPRDGGFGAVYLLLSGERSIHN